MRKIRHKCLLTALHYVACLGNMALTVHLYAGVLFILQFNLNIIVPLHLIFSNVSVRYCIKYIVMLAACVSKPPAF